MRLKFVKNFSSSFLFFGLALMFFLSAKGANANSSDAIAIRIVPNPNNYSILRWYENQGFSGSPQTILVDGYSAIRDGRTVYVNTANIKDNKLYADILIISYNQDSAITTVDIFGQLVKNLQFNTNITTSGTCSFTFEKSCLSTSECPQGEYCNSQKAKIIRDVKRLEDLAEIKLKLQAYKDVYSFYPRLTAGTYFSGVTLSVWPSWQQTLARDLSGGLPLDPINKLGACPGYDATTCWNKKTRSFPNDLSNTILPSGSHTYLYYSNDQGTKIKYCAQMESAYENIKANNCFDDNLANNPPTITGVSLVGFPGAEFVGYVRVFDADNNPLKLSAEFVSPSYTTWAQRGWRFKEGENNFSILSTNSLVQKKIYAARTGNYSEDENYYQIKLTVDDGQGFSNSTYSKNYPVKVGKGIPSLVDTEKRVSIGYNDSVLMLGNDVDGNEVKNLSYKSTLFNEAPISREELEKRGIIIQGGTLVNTYNNNQKTGFYKVNTYMLNPVNGAQIPGAFKYTVINKPPKLSQIVAKFSNKSEASCSTIENCSFSIDNGEKATLTFSATDEDGHAINYYLLNNFGGKLSIDKYGVISGLEKLNYQVIQDNNFTIQVKIEDNYCSNSSVEECSNTYSFNLLVKAYCSADIPASLSTAKVPGPIIVSKSGETLNTSFDSSKCSLVASSSADIKFVGYIHAVNFNQAIEVVSDVSGSMETNVTLDGVTKKGIDWLKEALNKQGGFFDKIYGIAQNRLANNVEIKIDLLPYSTTVWSLTALKNIKEPINILTPGFVDSLKGVVNSLSAYGETNTLEALNEAESKLDKIKTANTKKAVILLSDGKPRVSHKKYTAVCYPNCQFLSCRCGGPYPECPNDKYTPRDLSKCPYEYKLISESPKKWTYKQWVDNCGITSCYDEYCGSTNWVFDENAYKAGYQPCVYVPPITTYNNIFKFKKFFYSIFKPEIVQATTPKNMCLDVYEGDKNTKICPEPTTYCQYYPDWSITTINECDISDDVSKQAELMKAKGITIYTIYYNTSNSSEPEANMCRWSSNNGLKCDGTGPYAYAGTNIEVMMEKVINNLSLEKPNNVFVNGIMVNDVAPDQTESNTNISIKNLSCDNPNPVVTYQGNGSLEFTNLEINYCPAKLHP